MRKIWLVIKREYLTRVKTKGFVLARSRVPILSIGMIILSIILATRQADHTLKVAIVDNAGGLAKSIGSNLAAEQAGQRQARGSR